MDGPQYVDWEELKDPRILFLWQNGLNRRISAMQHISGAVKHV